MFPVKCYQMQNMNIKSVFEEMLNYSPVQTSLESVQILVEEHFSKWNTILGSTRIFCFSSEKFWLLNPVELS